MPSLPYLGMERFFKKYISNKNIIYNKCSIVADSLHVYIEAQVYYK